MSAPTGSTSPVPTAAWPTETFAGKEYRLYNDEPVIVLHQPNAHSDGDTLIFFQSSNVVAAGDVYSTVTYPVIDRQRGGTINGTIAALNNLIDLCTPKHTQEGGTYVIPGRGRISDVGDVVEYRDMVTIIRDRVADGVKRGLTLDQVKAEQPSYEYDRRYGAPTDYWTKDQFIEAVYLDLRNASASK
jgi:glyoxylase-like metal-dependent hydrolase (beta-lactamase superfamily II)